MAFKEIIFPIEAAKGASITYNHSVTILRGIGGQEQRYNHFPDAGLRRFSFPVRNITEAEYNQVIAFYHVVKGKLHGFRLKSWVDFSTAKSFIATADGIETEFQLQKEYTFGSETIYKTTKKIITGTIVPYVNDVEQVSGWSVNINTGILTFDVAPTDTYDVTATFEDHSPVRFETDLLSSHALSVAHNSVITLMEISI